MALREKLVARWRGWREAAKAEARLEAAASDTHPRVELAAKLVAVLAAVWFALAVAWEIGGPFGAGHVAASASIGVAGENMLRWKILGPVMFYGFDAPKPQDFYCNHPWGIFWTQALFVKVFGHHDFVCRLPAVLMSAASPLLLYGIARRIWGPVAGALAAASFVVTPIALAFGNFNALEVPVIFGALLCCWGYLRMLRSWRRRWMLVSVYGLFHAVNSDWAGFLFAAPLLAFMLPRGLLFNGRWFAAVDRRRFAQWWALSSSVCVGTFLFYVWQFQSAGHLTSLIGQGSLRSAGSAMPLEQVLESRRHWIELSFTPLAIFMGKLAAPLLLLRLVVRKRDLEIFPLAILVMATLQYVIFKQGADVHIFWPHYFAPYFALGMAALAATVQGVGRWMVQRWLRRPGRIGPPIVALASLAWVPLLMIPDGVTGLRTARMTGGRFDEKGLIIHQDVDKITALRWVARRFESQTSVAFHEGTKASWFVDWALERPTRFSVPVPTAPATGESQYYVVDTRFILSADLEKLVNAFEVTAIGPFWIANRARSKGLIDGHALAEREPTALEWYFVSGSDPIYTVVPDPFVTWELRHHFKQMPNPPPTTAPASAEQRRIAHNLAVANGDRALADRLRQELLAELDQTVATEYSGRLLLLGTRLARGVAPKLSVYFQAAGPITPEAQFEITSVVEAPKAWSLVPPSERLRAVGMPFELPTALWKDGFIYRSVSEIRARPGKERFYGSFRARRSGGAPPVKSGDPTVTLLTVGG